VDADDRRPRMRDATQGVEGAARGGSDLDDRAGAAPLHQGKERRELPSLLYCSAHLRLTREPDAVPEAEPPQDRVGTHEVSNEEKAERSKLGSEHDGIRDDEEQGGYALLPKAVWEVEPHPRNIRQDVLGVPCRSRADIRESGMQETVILSDEWATYEAPEERPL